MEEHTPAGASFELVRAADVLATAVRKFIESVDDPDLERALDDYDRAKRLEP
jgi:hypothetical protein